MKKLLSLVAAMIIAATTFAQVDEVTLTVIGTGVNEEQATLQALRSAIEQSFGTFVSANTTILNDRLVQDEIVSVSNGNVKEYQKLAVATLSNGQVSVSAKVTVSVNKLIAYAKSKGSRAEFAGQTYAANAKLMRLKAQSVSQAYKLMAQQLESIAKDMFDAEIEITGAPKRCNVEQMGNVYYFDCNVYLKSNIASTNFYNLYNKTLSELTLTKDEIELCFSEGIKMVCLTERREYPYSGNRSVEAKGALLPMDEKTFYQYEDKIWNAVYNAGWRYTIQEIGNPTNTYTFRQCNSNDGCLPVCVGYNEQNRKVNKYGMMLYSKEWNVQIHFYNDIMADSWSINRNGKNAKKWSYIQKKSQLFALDEVKTPTRLTSKEKKQKSKGAYTGSTYNVSYGSPKTIYTFKFRLAIPSSSIDRFQGFEIKY